MFFRLFLGCLTTTHSAPFSAFFGCRAFGTSVGGCRDCNCSIFRRLFVTRDVFTHYFFVAFSWPSSPWKNSVWAFLVVFSWLFRGPRFGQILRVLALEKSSDIFSTVRKGPWESRPRAFVQGHACFSACSGSSRPRDLGAHPVR